MASGTKGVCFAEWAAHLLQLVSGCVFFSLVDSEEPGGVDQVVYEPLRNLWRDTNSVVIFAHHYIEADICL